MVDEMVAVTFPVALVATVRLCGFSLRVKLAGGVSGPHEARRAAERASKISRFMEVLGGGLYLGRVGLSGGARRERGLSWAFRVPAVAAWGAEELILDLPKSSSALPRPDVKG